MKKTFACLFATLLGCATEGAEPTPNANDGGGGSDARVDGTTSSDSGADGGLTDEGGSEAGKEAGKDVLDIPDAPPDVFDANATSCTDLPDGAVGADAADDAATPICRYAFGNCTTKADCCCQPGIKCGQIGGLVQTKCCVEPGFACQDSNDCCGHFNCVEYDGGAIKVCQ